jgi:thiamine kinase-like enzyme
MTEVISNTKTHTAFEGHRRLASGTLREVAVAIKRAHKKSGGPLLIYDDATGRTIDIDLRGTQQEVLARLPPQDRLDGTAEPGAGSDESFNEPRGRGRPKLGVVTRTVTLLPRHWDWLSTQPGGASVALRKLVDTARRANRDTDNVRARQEAAYHFMSAIAGDFPGFEEATRALFASDFARFRDLIASWPPDVRDHAIYLALAVSIGDRASANSPTRQPSLPTDLIPIEKHKAIFRLIKDSFGGATIDAVTKLAGGASGPAAVFRVVISGTNYLLRLEGPPTVLRDSRRHFACLKIAGKAGVAPRLIGTDVNEGISITEFITVMAMSKDITRAARLYSIVETVKVLHSAPLFPSLMSYLDCVDILINQVRLTRVLPTSVLKEFLRLYGRLASTYPRYDQDLVSSHNDLNPSNVMFTGKRTWFVDWESAFAADRYIDIAAVANFFAGNEEDEEIVLHTYFGDELNHHHRARFFLMQQANRAFYAMVLLNSVAAAKPGTRLTEQSLRTPRFREVRDEMATLATPEGRTRFGCVFLNEAMHHLQSRRFTEAVAAITH